MLDLGDDIISIKEEHLNYLKEKGPFLIECSCEIFNTSQIEILKKYGNWFRGLTNGDLKPFTFEQRNFIECIKGEADPFTIEEKTWWLYLKRKEWEKEKKSKMYINYKLDEDDFYPREEVEILRARQFGTIQRIHRE